MIVGLDRFTFNMELKMHHICRADESRALTVKFRSIYSEYGTQNGAYLTPVLRGNFCVGFTYKARIAWNNPSRGCMGWAILRETESGERGRRWLLWP